MIYDLTYIHSKTSNKVLKLRNDKVKRTVILMLEIYCSIVLVILFLMHPPAVGSTGSFFSKLMSTDLSGPHPALSRCHFPSQPTLLSKRGFSVPPPSSVPSTPF